MKKTALFLLLVVQLFTGQKSFCASGPLLDFASRHTQAIGLTVAAYFLIFGIHFGLDRVPEEQVTQDEYEALLSKLENGTATLTEVMLFLRLYVFPGSKDDILDRTTITTKEDGTKVEVQDKFVRRSGTGVPAWIKRRILDNLEKMTKPILALCGVIYIINNALKDGTLPGSIK